MTSRESYLKELQGRLNEWRAEIEVLKADAMRAEPKTRAEFEKRIVELRRQCDNAERRIDEIRSSTDAGWEELREGADHMWSGIKQLLKDTRAAFREGRESAK